MKFGTQQHIWNSITVTSPSMNYFLNSRCRMAAILKIILLAISLQSIAWFQWNFVWGSSFSRKLWNGTECIFCFQNAFWASASGGFRIVFNTFVSVFDTVTGLVRHLHTSLQHPPHHWQWSLHHHGYLTGHALVPTHKTSFGIEALLLQVCAWNDLQL